MPTGYTSRIKDGISFKEYALGCAKAFGALIEMRDEPFDKPIPDSFPVSDYHTKKIFEAEEEIEALGGYNESLAKDGAEKEYKEELDHYKKYLNEKTELKEKYNSMLAKVNAYQPPTSEHTGYKDFMIEQIKTSIDFDCSAAYTTIPKLKTPLDWYNSKKTRLLKDLAYHQEQNAKEIERTNARNLWISQLKKSLDK